MSITNPKIDQFLNKSSKWREEMKKLRALVLDCGLIEELKWRLPCYTYQNSNVVIIQNFKDYCAISFFKGALLKDTEKVLHKPGENTQAGRLIRFSSLKEIENLEPVIKAYIKEAIDNEKTGLNIEYKKTTDYNIPEELEVKFNDDPDFKAAFDKLTPGRQRGYLLHYAQPKQSSTRVSRIEKSAQRIFDGKGLNDCICGHSKRLPNCDGSHKYFNQIK